MQKYYAYIMVNRKQIPLGYYENMEDAIAARKAAEEKYFRPRQEKVDAIRRMVKEKRFYNKCWGLVDTPVHKTPCLTIK